MEQNNLIDSQHAKIHARAIYKDISAYVHSHQEEYQQYLKEEESEEQKRQIIMDTLISLLPQGDSACANADRIFFGTNKSVKIFDEDARITYENILQAYNPPPNSPATVKSVRK